MQIKNIYLGSLTSLAIMASSLAHANQTVNVPSLEGGFTASVAAWYATPSSSNEDYGFSGSDESTNISNVTPGYEFGVDATLGYIFEHTANSIELLYRNHETDDSSTSHGSLNTHEFPIGHVDSTLDYELNAFDLMIGQIIDIGQYMEMRFSGGLAYVELEQTQDTALDGDVIIRDHFIEQHVNQKSEFKGWGPRVGIDARYDFGIDIGIVGGGSVAYYLGDLDSSNTTTFAIHDTNNDFEEAIHNDLDSHSVTNFRGNLGLDYVYFFDNEDRSVVGLELGYQVDYYPDVIGTTGGANDPDIDTFSTTFSGPYLNLKGAF